MVVMGMFFGLVMSVMFFDLVEFDEFEGVNLIIVLMNILVRLIGFVFGGFIYVIGGIRLVIFINVVSFFGLGLFEIFIKYEWKMREFESFF